MLDISRLLPQLERARDGFSTEKVKCKERIERALELYQNLSGCLGRISSAKTSWLIPEMAEEPSNFPLPAQVDDYAVIATDGSHIPPDRHSPISFFLINLGVVILRYGPHPQAFLQSQPKLFYKSDELILREPGGLREVLVEGVVLGARRGVEELRFLVENLDRLPPVLPSIALWDGTLILWGLTGFPQFVCEVLLDNGFIPLLEEVRRRNVPIAGYISFPNSTEVINLLRISICPYQPVDCECNCIVRERPCRWLDGLKDRELFMAVLGEGDRSPLFISRSSIVLERYRGHEIYFFYLKRGEEISRVEIPVWAVGRIDLIHSLIYSQVLKGDGYPVALMEAHQQAALSSAERSRFRLLVSQLFSAPPSPKRRSKQTPWI